MNKYLEREVFGYCGETCPEVGDAFSSAQRDLQNIVSSNNHYELESILDRLMKDVKVVGTEKLRDALREAVSDKNDVEAERDELQQRVNDLESEIESLTSDIRGLGLEKAST